MASPFNSNRNRKWPHPVVGMIFVVDDGWMPREQLRPPQFLHHLPLIRGKDLHELVIVAAHGFKHGGSRPSSL